MDESRPQLRVPDAPQEAATHARRRADAEAIRHVVQEADDHPTDPRAQRNAVMVALGFLEEGRELVISRADLLCWLQPTLDRLSSRNASCDDKVLVGRFHAARHEPEAAAAVFRRVARRCQDVRAAELTARALRKANQCSKILGVVSLLDPGTMNPTTTEFLWTGVLDALATCEDGQLLKDALHMAPAPVADRYRATLEARRRERQTVSECLRECTTNARRCAAECDLDPAITVLCRGVCGGNLTMCRAECE